MVKRKLTPNKFVFDKNNLDIAYLLGMYLTDGYIYKDNYRFRLRVIDEDLAQNIADIALRLFGKEVKVRKVRADNCVQGYYFQAEICSKSLCEWLRQQTTDKKYIPEWVYIQDDTWKKEFLAALIDGDGHVSVNHRHFKNERQNPTWVCNIGLCGEVGTYIMGMRRLLDEMNIKHSYKDSPPRDGNNATMRKIYFQPHSFIENNLYVKCKRKLKNLGTIIEHNIGMKIKPRILSNVQRLDAQPQLVG
jgi:hypothetical protein